MPLNLSEIITAAISGGLGVKALDFLHEEWKQLAGERRSAKRIVERHLDPILKSADELVGKIRSLAVEDFRSAPQSDLDSNALEIPGALYLLAVFWCRLQILRTESEYLVIGGSKRGRKLQAFIRALESTRVRLVSRTAQRAIGEALIRPDDRSRSLSLVEFLQTYEREPLRRLLAPLKRLFANPEHVSHRQAILAYGAVVHSLVDHLDRKHLTTRLRTGWGNKLSERTRKELYFRVFRIYLPFVHDPARYTQPPEKGLSARRALASHQASDTLVGRLLERLRHRFRWVA